MKRLILVLLLFAAAGFAGQRSTDRQHMGQMPSMMSSCPMMSMKGADIAVAETPNGIALTFTTKADVRGLRRHVQQMAQMHSKGEGGEMMNCCMSGASATYQAVPNGARLTLKPKDPAQLESFQKQIREHVQAMKNGECCGGKDSGYCPMPAPSK